MAKLITDRHIQIYQTMISQSREDLGRTATIYLEPTKTECAWCLLDPIHDVSAGIAASGYTWSDHEDYTSYNQTICPECGGIGYTTVENTQTVKGSKKDLSYNQSEDKDVGKFRPGTIRFSCDLNDVLVDSTDINGDTYFDRAIKVVLDGEVYQIVNTTKGGLRDLYTCRVILERTNK